MDTLPAIVGLAESSGGLGERAAVIRNKFGDGYAQRAADGLNSIGATFNAVWENIPDADAMTLLTFFRSKKGAEAFYFTPPRYSTPMIWTCDEWNDVPATCGLRRVTATFKREFDLV